MRVFFYIITGSFFIGCGMLENRPEDRVNGNVLVRGSKEFQRISSNAKISLDDAEKSVLERKKNLHPNRNKVISGPVVAIIDGKYLLSVPDKLGRFRLVGTVVDLESGRISSADFDSDEIHQLEIYLPPLIVGE